MRDAQSLAGRLNAGWLAHVLRHRGLPCPDGQGLQRIVAELEPGHRDQVVSALQRLGSGSDDGQDMELMARLWRCVHPATTEAFSRAGLRLTVSQVLTMLQLHPGAWATVNQARLDSPEGEQARDELRRWAPVPVAPPVAPAPPSSAEKCTQEPDVAKAVRQAQAPWRESMGAGEEPNRTPAGRDKRTGAAASPPAPASSSHDALPRAERPKARVFSAKAAAVFELDLLRTEPGEAPRYTMSIEATHGRAGHAYDWDDKIVFQLAARELPQVMGVLLGVRPAVEFRGHGPAQDKSLRLEHQGASVYLRLGQGRRLIALPIDQADLYAVTMVGLQALASNDPGVPVEAKLAVLLQLERVQARLLAGSS